MSLTLLMNAPSMIRWAERFQRSRHIFPCFYHSVHVQSKALLWSGSFWSSQKSLTWGNYAGVLQTRVHLTFFVLIWVCTNLFKLYSEAAVRASSNKTVSDSWILIFHTSKKYAKTTSKYSSSSEDNLSMYVLEVERAGNFSARELSWAFQIMNLASWAEPSFFRFWIWRAELSWAFSDFEFGELSWA